MTYSHGSLLILWVVVAASALCSDHGLFLLFLLPLDLPFHLGAGQLRRQLARLIVSGGWQGEGEGKGEGEG